MDQAQLEAFLTAQTRKQGTGGVSAEQAAALSRFWKSHWARVRESLLGQSRWEPGLKGLTWRVDLQTSASRGGAVNIPVALVELELGRAGEVRGERGVGRGREGCGRSPRFKISHTDCTSTLHGCLQLDQCYVLIPKLCFQT